MTFQKIAVRFTEFKLIFDHDNVRLEGSLESQLGELNSKKKEKKVNGLLKNSGVDDGKKEINDLIRFHTRFKKAQSAHSRYRKSIEKFNFAII